MAQGTEKYTRARQGLLAFASPSLCVPCSSLALSVMLSGYVCISVSPVRLPESSLRGSVWEALCVSETRLYHCGRPIATVVESVVVDMCESCRIPSTLLGSNPPAFLALEGLTSDLSLAMMIRTP
jgi:hypothetical protein